MILEGWTLWTLIGVVFFAFAAGVRLTWGVTHEMNRVRNRMDKNEAHDKKQQQLIDELGRAVAALQNENKTLEGRVSAASILLTSVTARSIL